MCQHRSPCPPPGAPDHDAARLVAYHPEQGWGLLCNGIVVFEDRGELLPDGRAVPDQIHQQARQVTDRRAGLVDGFGESLSPGGALVCAGGHGRVLVEA